MPRVKKRVEQLSLGPAPWRWEQEMSDHVAALSVSPDGAAVAIGTLAGEALVLSTSDGSVFAKLDEHPMGTLDVQWSSNGSRLASAGMDGQVQMYEVGRCDGALEITKLGSYGRKGWAQRLAWSPDGSRLAAGIGKTVTLIGADGVVIGSFGEAKSTVTDIVWTIDGRRVGVLSYGGVEWFGSGTPKATPDSVFRWKGSPLRAAMSPKGTFLVHGNQDNSIHVWRMSSGKDYEMTGYPSKVDVLAWSVDGNYLASGTVGCTTVWDCSGAGPAGRYPVMCDGHDRRITAVAWRASDNLLISASADGTIQWYRPTKGAPKQKQLPIGGYMIGGEVASMLLCPDDDTLIVATAEGLVGATTLSGR